jgi:glycosyltransferase involved in cell wall biosynthesis
MAGPGVEFAGWLTDEQVRTMYQECTAVLMPGVEDFGMVPVEAQACGRPVVALAEGGALETVIDGVTGTLVRDADADAFAAAVSALVSRPLDPEVIRRHAESFSCERFTREFQAVVDDVMMTREPSERQGTAAARLPQGLKPVHRENQP